MKAVQDWTGSSVPFSQRTVIQCLFLPTCSVCHFARRKKKPSKAPGKPAEALATCQIIAAGGARWHAALSHVTPPSEQADWPHQARSCCLRGSAVNQKHVKNIARNTHVTGLKERPSVRHTCDRYGNKLTRPRAAAAAVHK